jgi:hypothetical protein
VPRKVDHLERVRQAADELARVREARDAAIRRAVQSGLSLRVVGAAAGLSYERVRKIAAGE